MQGDKIESKAGVIKSKDLSCTFGVNSTQIRRYTYKRFQLFDISY